MNRQYTRKYTLLQTTSEYRIWSERGITKIYFPAKYVTNFRSCGGCLLVVTDFVNTSTSRPAVEVFHTVILSYCLFSSLIHPKLRFSLNLNYPSMKWNNFEK